MTCSVANMKLERLSSNGSTTSRIHGCLNRDSVVTWEGVSFSYSDVADKPTSRFRCSISFTRIAPLDTGEYIHIDTV